MAEKRTFESNTFACKTFACGTFANNQQTFLFVTYKKMTAPGTYVSESLSPYPIDFNKIQAGFWRPYTSGNTTKLLSSNLMATGSTSLMSGKALSTPSGTKSNALLTLGLTTLGTSTAYRGTYIVMGMGLASDLATGDTDPDNSASGFKKYSTRLMKEPK